MPIIAGYVPFTTVDWPQHLASAVFFQGCPLNCPYCQNKLLKGKEALEGVPSWTDFLDFLKKRQKRLNGVVLSGGEPLFQDDLALAVADVKALGFPMALHTSGVSVSCLESVLPSISWVGLDIKAPFDKYKSVAGVISRETEKSLALLLKSGIEFETRTTFDESILTKEDILSVVKTLKEAGVKNYALQECRHFSETGVVQSQPASWPRDAEFIQNLKDVFPNIEFRTTVPVAEKAE